jgi:hypothetical protein
VLSTRLTTHLTSGLLSAAGVSATAGALVAVVPIRRDRCTPGLSLIRAAPLLEAIGHRNMVRCRADTERIVHCKLQGNLALPDFVSFRLTWTATSTAAFGAYRATLASSPPRAPPLRSARYSATGVPRNLP